MRHGRAYSSVCRSHKNSLRNHHNMVCVLCSRLAIAATTSKDMHKLVLSGNRIGGAVAFARAMRNVITRGFLLEVSICRFVLRRILYSMVIVCQVFAFITIPLKTDSSRNPCMSDHAASQIARGYTRTNYVRCRLRPCPLKNEPHDAGFHRRDSLAQNVPKTARYLSYLAVALLTVTCQYYARGLRMRGAVSESYSCPVIAILGTEEQPVGDLVPPPCRP